MAATTSRPGPRTALVLGGSSDIGLAIVRRLSLAGLDAVVLAARDPEALEARLVDDRRPPPTVAVERWDASDTGAHAELWARSVEVLDRVDLVVCAVGSLGHHSGLGLPASEVEASLLANVVGPASALATIGAAMAAAGHGTIVVLSSVAGVRVRRSNFVYGAGKAGLDSFAQGLADAVRPHGVRVVIVRPGFVASRMTTGLDPAPFATTPEAVADAVADALRRHRSGTVWVPRILAPLFAVLRNLPPPVWRRIAGTR